MKEKLENAPYYSKFYNQLNYFMMTYQPTIYVWGKNDYLMIDIKTVEQLHNATNLKIHHRT